MKTALLCLVLLLFVALESGFTTLPLVLVLILVVFGAHKRELALFLALLGGILIDVLTLKPFGISSIFFVAMLGIFSLYERKFETQSVYFIFCATLLTSFFYLLTQGNKAIFTQSFVCAVLAVLLFFMSHFFTKKRSKDYLPV